MRVVAFFLDGSDKSALAFDGVVDGPLAAVRFDKAVVTFNMVSFSGLFLALNVIGVWVLNMVNEFVVSWLVWVRFFVVRTTVG